MLLASPVSASSRHPHTLAQQRIALLEETDSRLAEKERERFLSHLQTQMQEKLVEAAVYKDTLLGNAAKCVDTIERKMAALREIRVAVAERVTFVEQEHMRCVKSIETSYAAAVDRFNFQLKQKRALRWGNK